MKTKIYCKPSARGIHSFYLVFNGAEYYLFSQNYRKGVHRYFSGGVSLQDAMDYSKTKNDHAIINTMSKIPMYVKYIEKEYELAVFEKTKKHSRRRAATECDCKNTANMARMTASNYAFAN